MQNVLSFKAKGTEYTTKPFDFRAFCLIHNGNVQEDARSIYLICYDALEYMLDDLGDDAVNALSIKDKERLCRELWNMYLKEWGEYEKNE